MEPASAPPDRSPPTPGLLPSVANAPISVVLLAGAASPEVSEVVAGWEECFSLLKRDHEILVAGPETNVDLATLREFPAHSESTVRILTYPEPVGDGPALKTALAAATFSLFLYVPCDRQYHFKDLERFLGIINEVHLVCGYRVYQPLPGWLAWIDLGKRLLARILLGYTPPPRECWLGWRGWGRRKLARWIFGLRLQDVECRFRLLRRDILSLFPIQSRSEFTHIEVLAKANQLGCIMAEVPVSWGEPPTQPVDPTFLSDAMLVFGNPEFTDPTAKPKNEEVEKLIPEGG